MSEEHLTQRRVLVARAAGLDVLESRLAKLNKKIVLLQQRRENLGNLHSAVERTTLVVAGIPVHIEKGHHSLDVVRVVHGYDENFRYARGYLNAHNEVTWGLELQTGGYRGKKIFCGQGWESRARVQQIGIDWVVHGTLPGKQRNALDACQNCGRSFTEHEGKGADMKCLFDHSRYVPGIREVSLDDYR